MKDECKMLQKDKLKLTDQNKALKLDLNHLKDQFIILKNQKQDSGTSNNSVYSNPTALKTMNATVAQLKNMNVESPDKDELTSALQQTMDMLHKENKALTDKVKQLEDKIVGASRMVSN